MLLCIDTCHIPNFQALHSATQGPRPQQGINIMTHTCDWQSNHHIRRNIFSYCCNNYSNFQKNYSAFKKLFHTHTQKIIQTWSCFEGFVARNIGAVGFWFGCMVLENIWLCDTLIASHTCDSSRAQGAPSNFTGPPQTNSSAKKAEWPNLKKNKSRRKDSPVSCKRHGPNRMDAEGLL